MELMGLGMRGGERVGGWHSMMGGGRGIPGGCVVVERESL